MGVFTCCLVFALMGVVVQADSKRLTLIQILKLADADGAATGEIDIPRILEELSLTANDTTESYDDLDLGEIDPSQLEKGCSHGKCEFCTKGKFFRACVIAEILSQEIGFRVALTLNGHTVIEKKISVANPPPICLNVIPGLKMLADLCFEIYDVNLKEKSACARISFKVKLLHKKISLKIACFKLPFKDDVELIKEGGETTALSDFPRSTEEFYYQPSDLQLTEADLDDLVKECSKGKCKFCVKKGFTACMEVSLMSSKIGFVIILTFEGTEVMRHEITVPKPGPFCMDHTPVPQISNLCLSFEKINLKEFSACAKISFKAKIGPLGPKKFEYEQCFKIPAEEENVPPPEPLAEKGSSNDLIPANNLDVLSDLALTDDDITGLLEDCKKGTCKFCIKKGFEACLQIDVLSSKIGFDVILTFEGQQVLKQEITAPDPKPICIPKLPVPQVTDVCLTFKNINLKELSGCAEVSCKIKLGPLPPQKFSYDKCFKVPMTAEEDRMIAADVYVAEDAEKLRTEGVEEAEDVMLKFISNRQI